MMVALRCSACELFEKDAAFIILLPAVSSASGDFSDFLTLITRRYASSCRT